MRLLLSNKEKGKIVNPLVLHVSFYGTTNEGKKMLSILSGETMQEGSEHLSSAREKKTNKSCSLLQRLGAQMLFGAYFS